MTRSTPESDDAGRLLAEAGRVTLDARDDRLRHSAVLWAAGLGMAAIALVGPLTGDRSWFLVALAGAFALTLVLIGLTAYLSATRSTTIPRGTRTITRNTVVFGVPVVVLGNHLVDAAGGDTLAHVLLVCAVLAPYATGALLIAFRPTSRNDI